MAVQVITRDYLYEITKETLPVIVEFFASWCPKCALMSGVIEQLSSRWRGKLIFKKVDIEIPEKDIQELGIEIVPTFVVYRDGEIMGYTIGVLSEQILERRILDMLS